MNVTFGVYKRVYLFTNFDIPILQIIKNVIRTNVNVTHICRYRRVMNTGIMLHKVEIPTRCFETPMSVKKIGSKRIMYISVVETQLLDKLLINLDIKKSGDISIFSVIGV
jgi:hypothetical protein